MRVAIVDDEALARSLLREFLAEYADVEVVAECANGFEAVKAVTELKPDLLLLDVQMPKLDGFEVLELIERDVAVVFVTAYDQYALKAFEVHDVDNVHIVPLAKIDYIEAQDDYVSIHTDKRSFLKEQTMGELERVLDATQF